MEFKLTISLCSLGKEENKHSSYGPDAREEAKFKTKSSLQEVNQNP